MWRAIGLIAFAAYLIVKIIYEIRLEDEIYQDNLYIKTLHKIHHISENYSKEKGNDIEGEDS